ncbi:MAG: hypothetical protein ABIZ04_14700 [Opitutus sp.]
MEKPQQKFNRLVGALDDLVTQEAATLAERNFEGAVEIQERAEPLVSAIADLGAVVADAVARARVAGLLARRQHNIDFLESQLATARAELMAIQGSALRVAQIAPVYGRTPQLPRTERFNAAG